MKRGNEVSGLPVVDLLKGKKLGQVSRLIIDPEGKKIIGFGISTGSPFASDLALPLASVKSIGSSAITVTSAERLARVRNTPEFKKGSTTWSKLKGTKVLTESGDLVGVLDDFTVDWKTGSFRTLTVSGTTESLLTQDSPKEDRKRRSGRSISISAQYLFTIGEDAVIVSDSVEQLIKQALRHQPDRDKDSSGQQNGANTGDADNAKSSGQDSARGSETESKAAGDTGDKHESPGRVLRTIWNRVAGISIRAPRVGRD